MGYDEACASLHELIEGFLNLQLGTGIDAGGCLVENQHGRQAEHDAGDAEKLFLALLDKAVARVLGEDVTKND